MGVNNRARRAAKQRRRARRQAGGGEGSRSDPPRDPSGPDFSEDSEWDAIGAYAYVEQQVTNTVRRIGRSKLNDAELLQRAETLLRSVHPHPIHVAASVLGDLLARLADTVVRGGWGPADLDQLVRRNAGDRYRGALAAALHDECRRNNRSSPTWLVALDAVGPASRLRLDTLEALVSGLQVAALLGSVPLLEGEVFLKTQGSVASAAEHPKLARVRALLAKAESTEYDEEAEALSAKAQELISHYALGRLLEQGHDRSDGFAPQVRRIWIDSPYVRAKSALVHAVADANRCQSAMTEKFSFCLVVGAAADLDAVELLVTSLLVQANSAMLRHGRRFDESGVPRTRSFRQSFLMAYAIGIGGRLRTATDTVAEQDSGHLLPVLRDHEARVADAFDAMVPHTTSRVTSISNGEGWAAGLAAADLALLDVNGKLTDRTA